MMGADMAKIDLKKSMTLNTFPNSDIGTILVIIERITTVVVQSRNAIPEATYTIQVAVESANISAFIIDVNASAISKKLCSTNNPQISVENFFMPTTLDELCYFYTHR